MFGAQVGQALGKLADEVVTSTDVGLPLAPAGTGVLVPQNVAEFAAGLDRPADEVRLFLALREAASQRLFAHVPWLRQQLQDAVHAYARASRSTARRSSAGSPRPCPGWRAAWTRATPRASRSCWAAACSSPRRRPSSRWRCAGWRRCSPWSRAGWTPSSPRRPPTASPALSALAETMRRRRATGGPAEQTFATLVGPGAAAPPPARRRHGVGRHGPAVRRRRPRPALVAPRPAADLRRPRRADGLRHPPGDRRRVRRADGRRRRGSDAASRSTRRSPATTRTGPRRIRRPGLVSRPGRAPRRPPHRRCWPARRPRGSPRARSARG